jgi:hypothetical protein
MSEYDVSTGYSALEATSMTANRPIPLSLQPGPSTTKSVICPYNLLMHMREVKVRNLENLGQNLVALDYSQIHSTRASSKEEAKHWQKKKPNVSSGSGDWPTAL